MNHRSQDCEVLADTGISHRFEMVRTAGNAPAYSCSRSKRLTFRLRSDKLPSALNSVSGHYFDRARSLPAGGRHPEIGCQTWTRTKTSDVTGRRATFTLSGIENWSARQESHLRGPGPKPGAWLLRYALRCPDVCQKIGTEKCDTQNPGNRHRGEILSQKATEATKARAAAGNHPADSFHLGSLRFLLFENWRPRRDLHSQSSRRQRVAFLFSYGGG